MDIKPCSTGTSLDMFHGRTGSLKRSVHLYFRFVSESVQFILNKLCLTATPTGISPLYMMPPPLPSDRLADRSIYIY